MSSASLSFLIGLVVTSVAVGALTPHAAWGFLVLGPGLMTFAMMVYLSDRSPS